MGKLWEILEGLISKCKSIIGSSLIALSIFQAKAIMLIADDAITGVHFSIKNPTSIDTCIF